MNKKQILHSLELVANIYRDILIEVYGSDKDEFEIISSPIDVMADREWDFKSISSKFYDGKSTLALVIMGELEVQYEYEVMTIKDIKTYDGLTFVPCTLAAYSDEVYIVVDSKKRIKL